MLSRFDDRSFFGDGCARIAVGRTSWGAGNAPGCNTGFGSGRFSGFEASAAFAKTTFGVLVLRNSTAALLFISSGFAPPEPPPNVAAMDVTPPNVTEDDIAFLLKSSAGAPPKADVRGVGLTVDVLEDETLRGAASDERAVSLSV